jgi:putative SOS response-associated peptidase YedK
MCGRYELNSTARDLEEHFAGLLTAADWQALGAFGSYNIAPSQACLVIRYSKRDGRNVLERLVWGFRPQWSKKGWINARDDTLFRTAAFRESAQKRRCLVLATGWYEWQATGGRRKQPYYIHMSRPFAFAGIWTARRLDEQSWELSFAIVTTDSRGAVAPIHERMPLVLDPRHYAAWLDPSTPDPQSLLRPVDDPSMLAHPVSFTVNDPKNDTAACIQAIA